MESPESSTKVKQLFSQVNLDKYDITDCLDILRYVQTFDKADLQSEAFKSFIYKLECHIKALVLKK